MDTDKSSQEDQRREGVPARHPTDDDAETADKDKDEAVEEASEDSFPASDPPAW